MVGLLEVEFGFVLPFRWGTTRFRGSEASAMKSLPVRPGRFLLLVAVARRQPVEAAPDGLQRPAMRTHPHPEPPARLGDLAIAIDAGLSGEIDGLKWPDTTLLA
jgi:hypothetical protein